VIRGTASPEIKTGPGPERRDCGIVVTLAGPDGREIANGRRPDGNFMIMRSPSWSLLAAGLLLPTLCQCSGEEGTGAPLGHPIDGGRDAPAVLAIPDARSSDTFMVDAPPEPSAPPPWRSADVGIVGAPGGNRVAAGRIFIVRGGGASTDGSADAFHFLHQPLMGDGEVVAHLAELEAANPDAAAGVMIRQSLEPGAPHLALLFSPDGRGQLQVRTSPGAAREVREVPGPSGAWIKLARAGNTIRAVVSTDGQAWTEVGQIELALPARSLVGVAVTGQATDRVASAVFHSLRISAVFPPWNDSDVGDVAFAGSARLSGETVTLLASGADIAGPSDQFTYLHRPFDGDGEITARVTDLEFPHPETKVGLMFRAGLGAGAAHLSLLFSPVGNSVVRRAVEGTPSSNVRGTFGLLPSPWLRMVRIGPDLYSYLSRDGVSWSLIYREQLAMPAPPLLPLPPLTSVGLAMSARNNARVGAARLDNVVVKSYPPYPPDGGTDAAGADAAEADAAGADAP
jgi:hypothetical protein